MTRHGFELQKYESSASDAAATLKEVHEAHTLIVNETYGGEIDDNTISSGGTVLSESVFCCYLRTNKKSNNN